MSVDLKLVGFVAVDSNFELNGVKVMNVIFP